MPRAFATRFRARYAETDVMGVIHNATYFIYTETGRVEYLRNLGMDYRTMEASGVIIAVVDARCTYKASAFFDDLIEVRTWISEIRRSSLGFGYEIWRVEPGEPVLLVTGTSHHTCITTSGGQHRVVPVPPALRAAIAAFDPEVPGGIVPHATAS